MATGTGVPSAPGRDVVDRPKRALTRVMRWPVTISYFDKDSAGGEQSPIYSVAFELYDNGISRALVLDYNDFVLTGDMSLLEIKDSKPCR